MKKYLLILLFLPLLALVSCSDEKDLPDVSLDFDLENCTDVDGTIYVVQGQDMKITAVNVINNESHKHAFITAANYYWDYYYIGSTVQPPFGFEIRISDATPLGKHILEIESPLYAEGKEPAFSLVAFNVVVVASADDIPADGSATTTVDPAIANHATHTQN